MSLKQVIVLRKDLNMRKGKFIVQGSHASLGAYLSTPVSVREAWHYSNETKICVSVDSESELFSIHEKAKLAGLPAVLIRDAGFTEFKEPTFTAVGIGPVESELVDPITGLLKLL